MTKEEFFEKLKLVREEWIKLERCRNELIESSNDFLTDYLGKNVRVWYFRNGNLTMDEGRFIETLKLSPCLSIETEDFMYISVPILDLVSIELI